MTLDDIRRLALEGADPIRVLTELDRRGLLSRGRTFGGQGVRLASQRLRAIRPNSFNAMLSFLMDMTARRFGLPASLFEGYARFTPIPSSPSS